MILHTTKEGLLQLKSEKPMHLASIESFRQDSKLSDEVHQENVDWIEDFHRKIDEELARRAKKEEKENKIIKNLNLLK